MTSEFADVAQRLRGKPLRGPQHFPSRLKPFLSLFLFLRAFTHKHARFLLFSTFFLRLCPAWELLLLCKCPERLGLASLSGAARPLCAASRAVCWITGWMAVKSRWAEPRANKRRRTRPRALQGEVVCGCACS